MNAEHNPLRIPEDNPDRFNFIVSRGELLFGVCQSLPAGSAERLAVELSARALAYIATNDEVGIQFADYINNPDLTESQCNHLRQLGIIEPSP